MADIQEYTFIKNIEKLVEEKIRELNLKPKIPLSLKNLKKDNRRFYITPCEKNSKEKVFFKMLVVKEEYAAHTLKKEIEITKFLSNVSFPKNRLNLPLFVNSNSKNLPYWFLHQYLPGPLIGYFYEIHKQGLKTENIKKIADNLLALQSIPYGKHKNYLSKIPVGQRSFERHLKEIEIRKKFLKNRKDISFKKIKDFVKKREKYFKKEKPVLTHGDFTLANFFIHKDNVYITDWEHAHLDNFASDLSHLWCQIWRYPEWRKKLISYFLSKLPKNKIETFKELFRAMTLIEALGELAFSSEICEKKYKIGAKKVAQKTIQAAFKSFENLINL